jgi:hypothetical protein
VHDVIDTGSDSSNMSLAVVAVIPVEIACAPEATEPDATEPDSTEPMRVL